VVFQTVAIPLVRLVVMILQLAVVLPIGTKKPWVFNGKLFKKSRTVLPVKSLNIRW